jgi:hypothetical protein
MPLRYAKGRTESLSLGVAIGVVLAALALAANASGETDPSAAVEPQGIAAKSPRARCAT